MPNETILVVDDDRSTRLLLGAQLQLWGFRALLAESGAQGIKLLQEVPIDLVISDLAMPEMDGMQVLAKSKELFAHIPFIILSAHGSINAVVASMKQGANDFLQKPFKDADLLSSIQNSLASHHQENQEKPIGPSAAGHYCFQQIVSKSPQMTQVLQMAEQVSSYPQTTVAIYGESGVGKEVLARAIHTGSGRADNPFVAVNCAGIPATLLESELFGHVRGAYTGADRDRKGMFGLASHGTILLDEIGDMPLELQVKLLRVIEERTYVPLGSNRHVKVDFRIIVATHHDLWQLVQQGRFRSDLYHRIHAFPITIPPLRQRKEEIPFLANQFLNDLRREMGKPLPGISKRAMDFIVGYEWPGNIRELKNSLERAAIMVDNQLINTSHLAFLSEGRSDGRIERRKLRRLGGGAEAPYELHLTLEPHEFSLEGVIKKTLEITLARCNNNKSLAAQMLKTDRRVFYRLK